MSSSSSPTILLKTSRASKDHGNDGAGEATEQAAKPCGVSQTALTAGKPPLIKTQHMGLKIGV